MSGRTLLTEFPTPEELSEIQMGSMMDAIHALVDGTATIVRNDDGQPVGVEWPFEDCHEGLYWDADRDVVEHKASAGR